MNIKETPWETRNLGVSSSVEYYFERDDFVDTIGQEDVLSNNEYRYQVAHVPVGMTVVLNKLIKAGFSFAETKIELTADLKSLGLPAIFQRFSGNLSYHTASKEEIDRVYQTMERGVFATDKVSLDPVFNGEVKRTWRGKGNRILLPNSKEWYGKGFL